eukprot:GHRR01001000.1.p1 GENE.GHRR01001000.1~~GHRR01001000.1.p1  ORF type:complete len:151 (+),score=30.31 GHRR01001000.1:127-579(+)
MALALRSRPSVVHGGQQARPVTLRKPVVVRAGLRETINSIGDAFVRIFSKAKDNNIPRGQGFSEFRGRISHHGAGRPFKDNYVAGGQAYVPQSPAAAAPEASEADYLGGAVQNLVGHNFKGDDTEPDVNTGATGWKGDIHDRRRDGWVAD